MTKKMPSKPLRLNQYQDSEEKIHGVRLCQVVFEKRPEDIRKIYIEKSSMTIFSAMLRWAAAKRCAYKVIEKSELEKLTQSVHHEGICLIVKRKQSLNFSAFAKYASQKKQLVSFYLNGVSNPHNLGHILRTSAHFGVDKVLVDRKIFESVPASGQRVAEGGSEWVDLVLVDQPEVQLRTLKESGVVMVGTSSHATDALVDVSKMPKKIFILGEESHGMTKSVKKLCDRTIIIPGTGNIESLNVASAHAIICYEQFRK